MGAIVKTSLRFLGDPSNLFIMYCCKANEQTVPVPGKQFTSSHY